MKSRSDIYELCKALQRKIFTASFFRAVERVVKFHGKTIYFVHDRYTIKDHGIQRGRKWVELNNSNACTPFHSILLGLKTDIPVKTWWKNTKFEENIGTPEEPYMYNNTYRPDSEKPLVIRYIFGSGDALKEIVQKEIEKPDWQSLLSIDHKGWWFDNPQWIDRFAALGILTDCLEVFRNWNKMERD